MDDPHSIVFCQYIVIMLMIYCVLMLLEDGPKRVHYWGCTDEQVKNSSVYRASFITSTGLNNFTLG